MPDTVAMTLRLPSEIHERLRREAFDERVSVNSLIVSALTTAPNPGVFENGNYKCSVLPVVPRMTRPDLDALSVLVENATPGPWSADEDLNEIGGEAGYSIWNQKHVVFGTWYEDNGLCGAGGVTLLDQPTAEFIATSRTAIPALIAYARELEGRIEKALALHKKFGTLSYDIMAEALGKVIAEALARCNRCGRSTWDADEVGELDMMRLPIGVPCGGVLVAEEEQ